MVVKWSDSIGYSEEGKGVNGRKKNVEDCCPKAEELNGKYANEPTEKRIWIRRKE